MRGPNAMRRFLYYSRTAGAVALGLGPGLLLPFVLALHLSPENSDRAVLAFSVATSLMGIIVPAVEARSIAVSGQWTRRIGRVDEGTYRGLVLNSLLWTLPATVVGATVLGALYGLGNPRQAALWAMVGVVAITPLIGCVSAVNAGVLLSRGATTLPIATQGLRAAVPLVAVIALPGLPTLSLAFLFAGGELLRLGILSVARHRLRPRPIDTSTTMTIDKEEAYDGGVAWQMGANALGELNPVIVRSYLAPYANGSVTAFELSEKVVAMSTQIAYNFVILPRVGRWSLSEGRSRYKTFRQDSWAVFAVALASAGLGIVAIQVAKAAGVLPEAWRLGLELACIALLAGPAIAVSAGAVRYIVILGAQRYLTVIVAGVVVLNVIFVGLFVSWLGPTGAVVMLVLTRYVLALGLFLLIARENSISSRNDE